MRKVPAVSAARRVLTALLPVTVLLSACATTKPSSAAPEASADAPAGPVRARAGALSAATPQAVLDPVKLQKVLDDAAASMKSPGLVMAVQIGDGTPWVGVTGCQDEACARKMTPDMKFRVGSISKNFVGVAILQQLDEGKLSLDDSLEKWLPKAFTNIDGNAITVRQLLNHTSGIESYTENEKWLTAVYLKPTHYWQAPGQLLELVQELRKDSIARGTVIKPGSQFSYSNTNFILLGMIAAKADGHPTSDWEPVIQSRFFDKLGMRDSRIPAKKDVQLGSTNQGYVNFYNFLGMGADGKPNCQLVNKDCKNADADFTLQDMSNAWSAGEIISTVGDLLTFINAEAKGTLLSEKTRRLQQTFMETCTPANPHCSTEDVEIGLAMFKQIKYGFIGHRGEIFGFNGTIQYLPQKDLTVVVLSNRTALDGNHVGPIPETVAATLFPDLDQPTDPAAKARIKTLGQTVDRVSHIRLPARFR